MLDHPPRTSYLRRVTPRVSVLLAVASAVLGSVPARADPGPPSAAAADDLAIVRAIEADLVHLLDRVDGSTVSLLGCRTESGPTHVLGAGSGVVVRHRGTWLVTNGHVVNNCARVDAILSDGRRERVRVVSTDTLADLALLSFAEVPERIVAVPLEVSAESASEGTWVVATGNPFLLAEDGASAASLGVLSGQRGEACAVRLSGCSLQHDAEINPGSSGGPLWSVEGRLLGVNGAIVTRSRLEGTGPAYSGASFSVPVARVAAFIDQVLDARDRTHAVVKRPSPTPTATAPVGRRSAAARLGARLVGVVDGRGAGLGVRLRQLADHSPLRTGAASLAEGDRVVAADVANVRRAIRTPGDLERALAETPAGAELTLVVDRAGRRFTWTGRVRT